MGWKGGAWLKDILKRLRWKEEDVYPEVRDQIFLRRVEGRRGRKAAGTSHLLCYRGKKGGGGD